MTLTFKNTTASLGTDADILGRYDLYGPIHKALRLFMADTLSRIGATDHRNLAETSASLAQVRALLDACEIHIRHENQFIHPIVEQARGGASEITAEDHLQHERFIEELRRSTNAVSNADSAARGEPMARLYRKLSLFIAENFVHMHQEETVQNGLLRAHFADAELMAVQNAIVGSLAPDEMLHTLQWVIPGLNALERAGMLLGVQATLPPDAFEAVLSVARERLSTQAFAQLAAELGIHPVPGLAAGQTLTRLRLETNGSDGGVTAAA